MFGDDDKIEILKKLPEDELKIFQKSM